MISKLTIKVYFCIIHVKQIQRLKQILTVKK